MGVFFTLMRGDTGYRPRQIIRQVFNRLQARKCTRVWMFRLRARAWYFWMSACSPPMITRLALLRAFFTAKAKLSSKRSIH